ncbi:hypothetical protein BS17DRAFT_853876 [Gyrodon lividus]|nr:hypothetical protein BS17DRAFT_853876 [Gyrodon lividus]
MFQAPRQFTEPPEGAARTDTNISGAQGPGNGQHSPELQTSARLVRCIITTVQDTMNHKDPPKYTDHGFPSSMTGTVEDLLIAPSSASYSIDGCCDTLINANHGNGSPATYVVTSIQHYQCSRHNVDLPQETYIKVSRTLTAARDVVTVFSRGDPHSHLSSTAGHIVLASGLRPKPCQSLAYATLMNPPHRRFADQCYRLPCTVYTAIRATCSGYSEELGEQRPRFLSVFNATASKAAEKVITLYITLERWEQLATGTWSMVPGGGSGGSVGLV